MTPSEIQISTQGEGLYEITDQIKGQISNMKIENQSGILHLFVKHTSCALTISEAYDPSAAKDVEEFLKHLAPRNLSFIRHTTEGPDDSPSHMKSVLLNQSQSLIIEQGNLVLGTWQGIFLAEFRDARKSRQIILKFQAD